MRPTRHPELDSAGLPSAAASKAPRLSCHTSAHRRDASPHLRLARELAPVMRCRQAVSVKCVPTVEQRDDAHSPFDRDRLSAGRGARPGSRSGGTAWPKPRWVGDVWSFCPANARCAKRPRHCAIAIRQALNLAVRACRRPSRKRVPSALQRTALVLRPTWRNLAHGAGSSCVDTGLPASALFLAQQGRALARRADRRASSNRRAVRCSAWPVGASGCIRGRFHVVLRYRPEILFLWPPYCA